MGWSDYAREAETNTGGGDFPELPDDLYDAVIAHVQEPFDSTDFNGNPCTKFIVKWEIQGDDVPEGTQLWQYLTLPPKFLSDGFLSEKSGIYKLMEALGYDMEGRYRVDPPEWQGEKARVMVENKPNKDNEMRPRITGVKPARRARPVPVEKKQPVGAGAGKRSRADDDDLPFE